MLARCASCFWRVVSMLGRAPSEVINVLLWMPQLLLHIDNACLPHVKVLVKGRNEKYWKKRVVFLTQTHVGLRCNCFFIRRSHTHSNIWILDSEEQTQMPQCVTQCCSVNPVPSLTCIHSPTAQYFMSRAHTQRVSWLSFSTVWLVTLNIYTARQKDCACTLRISVSSGLPLHTERGSLVAVTITVICFGVLPAELS